MRFLSEIDFEDYINDLLSHPEKYAGNNCQTLACLFHAVYGFWAECGELPDDHVEMVFNELAQKYDHGNLLFGTKFRNIKELASVFSDMLYEKHGWEIPAS